MISKENPLAVELKYFVRSSNIYAKDKFHFIAYAGTIKEATYRDKALLTVLNVAAAIFQRKKWYFMIPKIAHNFSFECSSVVIAPSRRD